VIGSPRSGTTLTRNIFDAHPSISCGPETHFLIDLHRLADTHWTRAERFGIDRGDWDHLVRNFFEEFHLDYMRRRGRRRWADKTPGYALHLDYIDGLFPDARYVHVIRNGRDVVASYRYRWGYRAAVGATTQWVRHVDAARQFGRGAAADRYHEIRYEELVSDPEKVLRPMFEFLDEPWDANVLAFEQAEGIPAKRREETGDRSLIYTSRVGQGENELDPFLRRIFQRRAGRLMQELGYSR
jgi:hypothetical protein